MYWLDEYLRTNLMIDKIANGLQTTLEHMWELHCICTPPHKFSALEWNNHGQTKRYTIPTKFAIAIKALLPGSNATLVAHAEGLDELIVWRWMKYLK